MIHGGLGERSPIRRSRLFGSSKRWTPDAVFRKIKLTERDCSLAGKWVDFMLRAQHEICGSNQRIGQITGIVHEAEVWPSSSIWQSL
jgi:hypothetical protein